MLTEKDIAEIQGAIKKLASFYGVSLESVDYLKEYGHYCLRIIIDKPDGVSTQDCEQLSRAVSKKMDELDLISEQYFLEVSSPGKDEYKGVPDLSKINKNK